MVAVEAWEPSAMLSSTPVTVTAWAVSQLALVNVNVAGDTVASPVSLAVTPNTTLPVGSESSTTVNVSFDPASVTVIVVPESVNPAVSSSLVVTSTSRSASAS